jgi:hypothetical protein
MLAADFCAMDSLGASSTMGLAARGTVALEVAGFCATYSLGASSTMGWQRAAPCSAGRAVIQTIVLR